MVKIAKDNSDKTKVKPSFIQAIMFVKPHCELGVVLFVGLRITGSSAFGSGALVPGVDGVYTVF